MSEPNFNIVNLNKYGKMSRVPRWTRGDKAALLRGLKTFGHRDARNVQKLLPHKSLGAVRTMMYKYSIMAKLETKRENPLEEWLNSNLFPSNIETLIPQALLYIYLFEDHPPIQETGGFDIGAIYSFLYNASLNKTLPDLSAKDVDALRILNENLKTSTDYVESEVIGFINSICHNEAPKKNYSRHNK